MKRPPERIDVPEAGVVLRRHQRADVDALFAAIEASRDHLRPFMAWADGEHADTAAFVDRARSGWEAGTDFNWLVTVAPDLHPGEPERLLGGCGLHARRGPGAMEIGYWLRPDATGRGVMTAVAGRLADVALALDGISRVEIHCDVANERSAAIPRRLGFTLTGIESREPTAPAETGRGMVWVRHR